MIIWQDNKQISAIKLKFLLLKLLFSNHLFMQLSIVLFSIVKEKEGDNRKQYKKVNRQIK